jgi:hypothetical protein
LKIRRPDYYTPYTDKRLLRYVTALVHKDVDVPPPDTEDFERIVIELALATTFFVDSDTRYYGDEVVKSAAYDLLAFGKFLYSE